ncbi:ATP-dependent helicase, partial [Kineococcus sp. T13]|nr:ATP-dependent helicase [Kineococcus vitellinus]
TGRGARAVVLPSPAQEAAWVARLLRRRHLLEGVPWSRMAVLVRSAHRTAPLRRALEHAGVPLALPPAEVPLRDEPAVRPLLTALAVVLEPDALDEAAARELLTSPLGGADAVGLRRLRRALRRTAPAAAGRPGDA